MDIKTVINKHNNLLSFIYRILFLNRISVSRGNKLSINGVFLNHCKLVIKGKGNEVIIKGGLTRLYHSSIPILGNNCKVIIDKDCNLHDLHLYIENDNGSIVIGEHVTVTGETHLDVIEGKSIKIGGDCLFSSQIQFRVGDSHSIIDTLTLKRINPSKDIIVGNHVWIGHDVKVLKGAIIHDGSIVATGSIVTGKEYPSNCIIGGTPTRIIQSERTWCPHLMPIEM